MKKTELQLLFAGFFLCAAAAPAFPQGTTREEKLLETSAAELDKNHSEGQQRVTNRIRSRFGVDDGRVLSLRYRKMGYGEIAIALGLAQDLPGGITDENVQKVVTLRQGPPVTGWGKVASELGLKLGPALSKVQKLSAEVRKKEKSDKDKKIKKEKTGDPEKHTPDMKLEQPEKQAKDGSR